MADPIRVFGGAARPRRSDHAAATSGALRHGARELRLVLVSRVAGAAIDLRVWVRSNERSVVQLAVVALAAGAGLALVLYRRLLFPAKFSYDSDTIHRLAVNGNVGNTADDSFGNVASVYRIAGLQNNDTTAAVIGYALALLALAIVFWSRRFAMNAPATVACVLTVLFSAVYLGTYSKDVFVLPVTLLLLTLAGGAKRELVIVAALIGYAEVFRGYWYLVAGFYVVNRIVTVWSPRRWVVLVTPFIGLVLLGVAFPLALGHPSDFARDFSNQWRVGSPDAATMITDFVTLPGPLGSIVNTVIVFVMLFVPLPLLVRGGVYYLGIGLSFVALWAVYFVGFARAGREPMALRAIALLLAFSTTQALFEPDYGSALRHLTPLLPLLCFVALAPKPSAVEPLPRTMSIPVMTGRRRSGRGAVG